MNNKHIAAIQINLDENRKNFELGLEGYNGLTDFLHKFSNIWRNKFHGIVSEIPEVDLPTTVPSELVKLFKKVDNNAVSMIKVYKPAGFKNHITPYTRYLQGLIGKLSDIEKRLYHPITDFFNDNISDETYSDAPWINKDLSFINAKKELKEFQSFFDKKQEGNSTDTTAPFNKLYISTKDYLEAGKQLKKMEGLVKGIDLDKLKKSEDNLYRALMLYIKLANSNPEIVSKNKQTIRKLSDVINAVAVETELLASVIYSYITLQEAFNDSSDKLIKNLKG